MNTTKIGLRNGSYFFLLTIFPTCVIILQGGDKNEKKDRSKYSYWRKV